MDAVHRKVMYASRSKRAAITHTFCQYAQSKWQFSPVSPDRLYDLAVVIGLYLPDPVGYQAHPCLSVPICFGHLVDSSDVLLCDAQSFHMLPRLKASPPSF
jgi:hypothetical protein